MSKTVNIYALTRAYPANMVRRFERHLSNRESYLHIKEWEIEGMRKLADRLCTSDDMLDKLNFYYSFQIPKLGKEFDLLQIGEDIILNIELKSEAVSDEKIRKQLLLNKHYLASLGKDVYSFTYISSIDRLVRLTGSEKLVEADFEDIRKRLTPEGKCITAGIEKLFREDTYLISPLEDPDKFLRRDYFLTSQQKDIKNKIIRSVEEGGRLQGFTGLPGTGKTLLLFDLAMWFSGRQRVCVLHCGNVSDKMRRLDTLLKRIDFVSTAEVLGTEDFCGKLRQYAMLFVDEGHRLLESDLEKLLSFANCEKLPIVFSYDREEDLHPAEREHNIDAVLGNEQGYCRHQLTNRIRINAELSDFIRRLVHIPQHQKRKAYDCVHIAYAENDDEQRMFQDYYMKKGYRYIDGHTLNCENYDQEYDKVVMSIDDSFYYDEKGYLHCRAAYGAGRLFSGFNRARTGIAIIVVKNDTVFERIMQNLQGGEE